MKRYLHKILPLFLGVMLLLTLSCGLSAADLPNEESADSNRLGLVSPSTDGLSLIPPLVPTPAVTDGNLIIVIDPGHGNNDSGTLTVDGSYECTLNLKVAKYLKAYLEQYDNVTVYMTHEDPYNPRVPTLDRVQRGAIAGGYGADVVVSLHFNAAGGRGSVMLLSVLEEYRLTGLGQSITNELSALGIKSNAPLLRKSESEDYWTDNIRLADYYGMIRQPAYYEIPSIIVEHCFVDNASDYYNFASSDAKLKALAEADGRGIVNYFDLNENISATTLESIRQSALQRLENQYVSMDLSRYSAYHKNKIIAVYEDAKKRIEIANNTGKIDLTADRAVMTMQNYPKLGADETAFSDVKKSDWFCPAVEYCVNKKLFYGTSTYTFSPYQDITRGQFITVLGRYHGVAETTPTATKFSDVDPQMYYAPHIKWATDENIVAGLGGDLYGPEQKIRREDLLRMLHNYCIANNIELPTVSNKTIADFKDSNSVDSWGIDAMNWAIAKGIIVGDEKGYLNPRDNTIRAEVAQIMMKFTVAVEKL